MNKTIEDSRVFLDEMSEELVSLMDFDIMEMYRFLTDKGNELGVLPPEEKTPENFVHGCTSNVYVSAKSENGVLVYRGSSEAHIVRGYLAILVQALSGLSPRTILDDTKEMIEGFAEKAKIKASLTPSRANAFGNIYQLMRRKAEEAKGEV